MKIVIAPDSFKESLSASQVCDAIEAGFKEIFPVADYVKIPMADGGEGTVASIVDATNGKIKKVNVTGPLGEEVEAFYGLSGDGKLAVIEMAASSGLDKVAEDKRNPLKTTTWGFGELIADALEEGVDELLLGLGGSATNDGGAGMVMSLGGRLLDASGEDIQPTGEGLEKLASIDLSHLHPRLQEVTIRVAGDVSNPLTGADGAAYVYGEQKGGTEEQIAYLDQSLKHYAEIIRQDLDRDIEELPGAGAAGGLGGGLVAFLNASLEEGGKLIVDRLNLAEVVKGADLVITGEGGINHQTVYGKTPVAVARVAKESGVPVIALAAVVSDGHEGIFSEGVTAVFSILPKLSSKEEAFQNAAANLQFTAVNIARVLKMGMDVGAE